MTQETSERTLGEGTYPPVEKIQLILNKEVLKELKKEKLNVNHLFVLFSAYHEAIDLLDLYDDNTRNQQVMVHDYEALIIHGFLKDTTKNILFEISDKGKEFVERIHSLMGDTTPESSQEQSIKQLCQTYLELWPKIKLPSQKYARVSILEIEKKMKAWLKAYKPLLKKEYGIKLTDEDILQATKSYIDRYARNGYKFMVTSSYFIQKNEKSALADEILAQKQGLEKTQNTSTKDNITVM